MMTLYNSFIIQRLKANAINGISISFNNKSISSDEILQRSIRQAIQLDKFNIKSKDKVLILTETNLEFVINFYALTMLDAVIVLMDPQMGFDHFKSQLKHLSPDHILIDSKLYFLQEHPILRWIIGFINPSVANISNLHNFNIITVGTRLPIVHSHRHLSKINHYNNSQINWMELDINSDFIITYTSGTTSDPKGVFHSYQSIEASLLSLANIIKRDERNIKLVTNLPHYLLLSLNIGLDVAIWKTHLNGKEKYDFILENGITTIFGPPSEFISLLEYLEKCNYEMPETLTHIYLGSAPVNKHFLQRLIAVSPKMNITCIYGMTENLVISTIDGRDKVKLDCDGDLVGNIEEGVKIEINENGELQLMSNQLFTRYFKQSDRVGFHSSGDLAFINENGQIVLMGRLKDMIIKGNFNIYPSLYEATINRIPGIGQSTLIGIYNEQKADEEIILVINEQCKLTAARIKALLSKGEHSIDSSALPDRIIFMDIPLIGRHSKVNKQELRRLLMNQKLN